MTKPRDVEQKFVEVDAAIFVEEMKAKLTVLVQYAYSEQRPLSFVQEQLMQTLNECNVKHKVFKSE